MSAVALIVSTRGQRNADALATRSAAAAERMAVAPGAAEIQEERPALMPSEAWTLEQPHGDAYFLNNAGRATAYEVRVESGRRAHSIARCCTRCNKSVRKRLRGRFRTPGSGP